MFFLALIFGIIPGLFWLYFYLQEDTNPEPKRLIFKAFLFGIIGACMALGVQLLIVDNFPSLSLDSLLFNNQSQFIDIGWIIITLLIMAFIEELFKFGSAFFSIHKNREFDEPIDAMIYSLTASIGFATLENIGVLLEPLEKLSTIQNTAMQGVVITNALAMLSFRFVGATLLHALMGAIIGYFWALSIREFGKKSLILKGIIYATLLHAVFNYLILVYGGTYMEPILFLLVLGFFVLNDFDKLKNKKI